MPLPRPLSHSGSGAQRLIIRLAAARGEGDLPGLAFRQRATLSRASLKASAAFWPAQCRLEGLPQHSCIQAFMAARAAGLIFVVAALSA